MSIFTFSIYFWLKIRIFKIKQGLTIFINFFQTPKYGTSFSIPFWIPFLPFENRGQWEKQGATLTLHPRIRPFVFWENAFVQKRGYHLRHLWWVLGYTAKREMSEEIRVSPMIFLTMNALGGGGVETLSGARYSEKRYCRYGATHFFILLITNITYLYYCLFIGLTFWCYLFMCTGDLRLTAMSKNILKF